MADPDVKIKVSAQDQASGVFENIARSLKNMKRESRLAGESALEQALSGPRGASGAIADYLGVGLQSIIVDKIGEAFKTATDKIIEMRQALAEGKVTMGDMVTEMARGLPILGGFVSGFLNVREIITGEKAEIAETVRQTEQMNKLLEQQATFAKRVKEEHEGTVDAIRKSQNASRLLYLQDPELTREKIRQQRQELTIGLDKEFAALPKNARADEYKKGEDAKKVDANATLLQELDELAKKQNAYNKRFNELSKGGRVVVGNEPGLGPNPDMTQAQVAKRRELIDAESEYNKTLSRLQKEQDAADLQRTKDKNSRLFEINRAALAERVKFEADTLKGAAQKYLADYNQMIEDAAEASREKTKREAMFREMAAHQVAANRAFVGDMGPGNLVDQIHGRFRGLASQYDNPTVAPGLVMGQGSGLASRQREEASARDDSAKKLLLIAEQQAMYLARIFEALISPTPSRALLSGAF